MTHAVLSSYYQTWVNTPRLNFSQIGRYSEGMRGWVDLGGWSYCHGSLQVVTYNCQQYAAHYSRMFYHSAASLWVNYVRRAESREFSKDRQLYI